MFTEISWVVLPCNINQRSIHFFNVLVKPNLILQTHCISYLQLQSTTGKCCMQYLSCSSSPKLSRDVFSGVSLECLGYCPTTTCACHSCLVKRYRNFQFAIGVCGCNTPLKPTLQIVMGTRRGWVDVDPFYWCTPLSFEKCAKRFFFSFPTTLLLTTYHSHALSGSYSAEIGSQRCACCPFWECLKSAQIAI